MNEMYYLYVEDDRLSRTVMELLLRDVLGTTNFTIFEDSTDFAERLEGLPIRPDVILLDIHVRPLNGFKMLELIRANPAYQACRVIALTASVMNEEVDALREAGFDGAVGKPLDALQFPRLLEKIERGERVWQIA